MRLIHDDVTIGEGAGAIRLRPSLRAAMRLHCDFGLPKLMAGVNGVSLSIMVAIIEATADRPRFVREHLDHLVMRGGLVALSGYRPALSNVLAACFGLDREPRAASNEGSTGGKRLDFDAHFERLFEIGTGWLGWSPVDTYAATPAEILIAQRGKIELLKAIHGTAEKDGDKPAADPRAEVPIEKVRDGIARLRALDNRAL